MAYDKKKDYSELMEAAAARGDYRAAGEYEKLRNEKIAGEGLDYEQTNRYTGNLDDTDYSSMLMTQIGKGASKDEVADTLRKRNQKISTAENLAQYANDKYTQAAMDYISSAEDFSYETAPSYANKYSAQIDALMNSILGGSYEKWTQGDEYGALKGRYEQQGQKAMDDTLAKVGARTGGIASSYATGAAQNSYNDYMSALEEAAMALYENRQNEQYQQLAMLQGMENDAYSRYLDRLGQYNADRSFAHNQRLSEQDAAQLALENQRWEQQYADNMRQQEWENQFAQQQYDDAMRQQNWENAFAQQKYADSLIEDEAAGGEVAGGEVAGVQYSVSDIIKLYESGLIDEITASQMLGVTPTEWIEDDVDSGTLGAALDIGAVDTNEEGFSGTSGSLNGAAYKAADAEMSTLVGNEDVMWEVLGAHINDLTEDEVAALMEKYGLE